MSGLARRLVRSYLRLPHDLRAMVPAPLRGWMRRLAPALPRRRGLASQLEPRLWGGFSRSALARLEGLKAAAATKPAAAAEAARVLARWHGVADDFEAARTEIVFMRTVHPPTARMPRQYLLEALFLVRLGRGPEARALIEARLGPAPALPSARLLLASAENPAAGGTDPAASLSHLNAVLAAADLAPLGLADPAQRLGLDNLGPARPLPPVDDAERITVIVPAHAAAATLPTALAGLLAQTWTNLEILVVDDASPDDTAAVAEAFAARDPRVRLIRQPANLGAYAARNRGLAEATGAYLTVHDADDWSHPEKLARHVAHLRETGLPFNLSAWVRASDDLVFVGPWRPTENFLVRNLSSAFLRRETAALAGPWDTARVSADREYVNRLQTLFGLAKQAPFLAEAPLAFGRASAGSATTLPATHVASQYHGLRRDYHESCDLWHAGLDAEAVRAHGLAAHLAGRGLPPEPPFCPAPVAIRSRRETPAPLDLLFVGDFNFLGGTYHSAMNMVRAGLAEGMRAGLLHYRRYDEDLTRPLKPEVRAFAAEHGLRLVVPGETAEARHVIVTYPPVFEEALDRFPRIDHDHLTVVVNQMAARTLSGTDVAYDPLRVRAHLAEFLGAEGHWAPISERVRALMASDPRYPPAHGDTWTPLIDVETWCAATPRWRGPGSGSGRARPVLGRHGRDHRLKWPADPAALRAAYCAEKPCEVRFLGGARYARRVLGTWPANWHEEPFGARDVPGFLTELDVFLHVPDRDYIEEFGRAPMEAMAVGVPVILPPEFAATFGEAALYAEPEGVWPLVAALWADRAAWEARVAAGRAFVTERCSHAAFAARLARIEAEAGPAEAAPAPALSPA